MRYYPRAFVASLKARSREAAGRIRKGRSLEAFKVSAAGSFALAAFASDTNSIARAREENACRLRCVCAAPRSKRKNAL